MDGGNVNTLSSLSLSLSPFLFLGLKYSSRSIAMTHLVATRFHPHFHMAGIRKSKKIEKALYSYISNTTRSVEIL
jgi:hypothetical protein